MLGNSDRGRSRFCRSLCKKNLKSLTGFLTRKYTLKGKLNTLAIIDDAFGDYRWSLSDIFRDGVVLTGTIQKCLATVLAVVQDANV